MTQLSISKNKRSSELRINKGVELMMGGNPNPTMGKPTRFSGMISFFGRELHFNLEFSLFIKRKTLGEKQ